MIGEDGRDGSVLTNWSKGFVIVTRRDGILSLAHKTGAEKETSRSRSTDNQRYNQ